MMWEFKLLSVLFVSIVAVLVLCLACCNPEGAKVKALLGMTHEQRRAAFAEMPPDKQLDIYLVAARGEPGHNLSEDIAGNWRVLLPVLKVRLSSEAGEAEQTQLIWLLAAISNHHCSLVERKDILEVASQVVSRMGEPSKRYAQEPLGRIVHPANQLPPCI